MANPKGSPEPPSPRYICTSCSRTFRRVEHLRRHEATHTGNRPHSCPRCGHTFFRGDVLLRHMRNVHKDMVSGVKDLRTAAQLFLRPKTLPKTLPRNLPWGALLQPAPAAGTSLPTGDLSSNPNPQNTSTVGPPHLPLTTATSYEGLPREVSLVGRSSGQSSLAPSAEPPRLGGGGAPDTHQPMAGSTSFEYMYGVNRPSDKASGSQNFQGSAAEAPQTSGDRFFPYSHHGSAPADQSSDNARQTLPSNTQRFHPLPGHASTTESSHAHAYPYASYQPNLAPTVPGHQSAPTQMLGTLPHHAPPLNALQILRPNQPMQGMIPYGYGQYAPPPPGWPNSVAQTVHHPAVAAAGAADSSREAASSTVGAATSATLPTESPAQSARSGHSSYDDTRGVGFEVDSRQRPHEHHFVPQDYAPLASSGTYNQATDYSRSGVMPPTADHQNNLYCFGTQQKRGMNQPDSLVNESLPPRSSSFKENDPRQHANTVKRSSGAHDLTVDLNHEADHLPPNKAPLGGSGSHSEEKTDRRKHPDTPQEVPEVCAACGKPFVTTRGRTHDFSLKDLGDTADYGDFISLLVGPQDFDAPSNLQLDRYIAFFSSFVHPIIPLIHQSTFDRRGVRPANLFAICSLGAALLQEYSMARLLHFNADRLLTMDWKTFLGTQLTVMDVETWLYFVQTSLYIEWQSFSIASSPSLLKVGYGMRDLQQKLFSYLPAGVSNGFASRLSQPSQSTWISEQQVLRCFAAALALEYFLVCCYSLEPRHQQILEVCKALPLPCSELLWNTCFPTEEAWRLHFTYERDTNNATGNPLTFSELLSDIKDFEFDKLMKKAENWNLDPINVLILATFACVEFEVRKVRIDEDRGFLEFLQHQIRAPSPPVGQCGIVSPFDEPSQRTIHPLANYCTDGLQLASAWDRIWHRQHPLAAIGSMVMESSLMGLFIDVTGIKRGVCTSNSPQIFQSLLRLMFDHTDCNMTEILPVVGLIMDFVHFGHILGPRGLSHFKTIYSFAFVRTVGALISHRALSFFCCWAFSTEFRARTGKQISEKDRYALKYIEKACLDFNLLGIDPLEESSSNPYTWANVQPGKPPNSSGVKLSITAGIVTLIGTYSRDMAESIPGKPFYKALLSVGSYLSENLITVN